MSRNHPLSYPAPQPPNRHFHPLRLVDHGGEKKGLLDTIFGHPFMRGPFKKISGHGTIPIIIGAAVVAEGHSQMLVRSVAVVLCAVWLSLDIGVWISETKWQRQYKAITFCAASWLLCCGAMGIMYWFLESTLEDQRADVFQNLGGSVVLPPSGYVMNSSFTFRNNGKTAIGSHQISCSINRFYANDGKVSIENVRTAIVGPQVPLEPGGDGQSEICWFILPPESLPNPKCADITLEMVYVLETQPKYTQHKEFRFIADKKDDFAWHQHPVKMRDSPCRQ
jgi:hypothetical protein